MKRALMLAQEAARCGEVPVGAVVVRKSDGLIVGEGRNRREERRDPLAHAELEAIAQASVFLGGWRLSGCELYVTLEPCPMCAGAVVNSRIDRVIFGAYDTKCGACGSVTDLFSLPYSYRPEAAGGFMAEQCEEILKAFFGNMRRKRKMNSVVLTEALTDDQLGRIADIADEIWHEYFPCILTQGQIDYMVSKFCSFDAMKKNIAAEGYSYRFIRKNGAELGYTAYKTDGDRLFLSKLYLFRAERGKKYARGAFEALKDIARERGLRAIWLTVNKHNDNTIAAYKALGFKITGEGVTDIGGGYVMDDYYMEYTL